MSLLDHPQARALLDDATLSPTTVRQSMIHLTEHLQRYLPLFYRSEQRRNASLVFKGLLSGLERKTCEPIAIQAGLHRKPVQYFVGEGKWDDERVMAELRKHVCETIGESNGVVIVDGSSFPKKGTESCGVDRQWCGRLGKVDNCQAAVFLAYAGSNSYAPLDRRLYLPEDWASDKSRREKCRVPPEIVFQEKWRIALDLLDRSLPGLPHSWIVADDEYGRSSEFRAELRGRGESYVLDVPCNTLVRDLSQRRPRRSKFGPGRKREVGFVRADRWAARQPASGWTRLVVRDGAKGPLEVDAIETWILTKQDSGIGKPERLVVIRAIGESRMDYELTNAGPRVPLCEVVRAKCQRHRIEEMFAAAKGDAGLGHYEVRSWIGWHHHITLSMVAMFYLCLEQRRVGKKTTSHHGVASASGSGIHDERQPSDI